MKNEYWTNRHYDYTNNIKEAVKGMNEDIKELSKCCDILEEQLIQKENIIKEVREYIKEVEKIDNYLDGVPCIRLLEILDKVDKGE